MQISLNQQSPSSQLLSGGSGLQECKQPASNYMLIIFVYDAYLWLLACEVMESCLFSTFHNRNSLDLDSIDRFTAAKLTERAHAHAHAGPSG